jgi:hypothetical protein
MVDGATVKWNGTLSLPIAVDLGRTETITIIGWAVDSRAGGLASAVFVTFDGTLDIPTLYGLDRVDVANAFSNPNFRFSGFLASFSSSILRAGEHTMTLKIVGKSEQNFYYSTETVLFVVK